MKNLLRISATVYFGLLIYIFFLAKRRPRPSIHWHNHSVNYVPIRKKLWFFQSAWHPSTHDKWMYYSDLFGNILIFIPLVIIFFFLFNVRSLAASFWLAVGVSVFVEGTQFVLDIGVADVDDLLLNSLGALIGVFVVKQIQKMNSIPLERFNIRRY